MTNTNSRLMNMRVPACPDDGGLKNPVRSFDETTSMERSFFEYHFGLTTKKEQ